MSKLFDKLNLKDHREILVVNAPLSFESELAALTGVTVLRDLGKVKVVRFALVFATVQTEVDRSGLPTQRERRKCTNAISTATPAGAC